MYQVDLEKSSRKSHLSSPIASLASDLLHGPVVQGHKRPLHEGLPQRLRWVRKKSGLTQSALGQLIQWGSTSALEEGGQRPAIDTVERLASVLGVDASWLAYGDEANVAFRQRQPRAVLPPDPPEPTPGRREPQGRWRGVSERLRAAREAKGLSLRAVAAAAEISPQALSMAEAGRVTPAGQDVRTARLRVGRCSGLAGLWTAGVAVGQAIVMVRPENFL